MVVHAISKTEIRLVPAGFCWVFNGRENESGERVTVEIHFDFLWLKHLAHDLREVLRFRDEETEAARRCLGSE